MQQSDSSFHLFFSRITTYELKGGNITNKLLRFEKLPKEEL